MPSIDPELRSILLDFYLDSYESEWLSDWLREIGEDHRGSIADRQARIRSSTKYLAMATDRFPQQTESYLEPLSSDDLGDLCDDLGLDPEGTKEQRFQRIMREIRFREGWIARPSQVSSDGWNLALVKPYVELYSIPKRGKYEEDFCNGFEDEMIELFGAQHVHREFAIGRGGATVKIDFHLGPANGKGVGVEMKMPTSNSELQRAIGQLDQYMAEYGGNLLLVLVPDFLSEAQKQLFAGAVASRGIQLIEK